MSKSPVMSIGAVAKAVGLSEGTLRNWERRYGYPKPSAPTEATESTVKRSWTS